MAGSCVSVMMDRIELSKIQRRMSLMRVSRNYHSILMITIALFTLPAYARQQPECDAAVTVHHHGDELLDEEALQKHIDGISKQMDTVRLRHTRGPHLLSLIHI